jgi:hypothetical protein
MMMWQRQDEITREEKRDEKENERTLLRVSEFTVRIFVCARKEWIVMKKPTASS